MTPDFDWPLFLRQLDTREHAWNQRRVSYPRPDAVPFMPYPLPLFAALLLDAVQAAPGWGAYDADGNPQQLSFLDVGCGPGTKMLLAEMMFDLDVHGIDIVPEFIAEARDWDMDAEVCDAYDYEEYAEHAIVLVNRPSGLQDDLEPLVLARMRPGAVLIAVNWRNNPSRQGWQTISEEWGEPVRGVYAKPPGLVHLMGQGILAPTACCGIPAQQLPEQDTMTTDRPEVTCRFREVAGEVVTAVRALTGPDDGGFLGQPAEPAAAAEKF